MKRYYIDTSAYLNVLLGEDGHVKIAKDLKSAKVYVQVIGTPEDRVATIKGMQSAVGFIRKELRERLSLRQVPELTFFADESAEKADKVLGLLAEISRKREEKALDAEDGDEDSSEKDDDE